MNKKTFYLFMVLLFFMVNGSVQAKYFSPEGYWKTFDDDTHELESIVKLWIEKDELKGRIVKLFPKPDEDPDPKCDKCPGKKKDMKILGMIFLWGFSREGDRWIEGKILDPENGKTYHCRVEVVEGGKKMKVFGYIKIIFKIGRTQTWIRTDKEFLEKKQ